jgi:adenosylhomocysteine nucleosidase
MLALVAAMREEIAGLKKLMSIEQAVAESDCRFYRGNHREKEVLLVQTGIGREAAVRATALALERFPITTVVSFGLSGGLTDEIDAGDVVLCATLHCQGESGSQVDGGLPACFSDAALVSLAAETFEESRTRWTQADSVTVAGLVRLPEDKYRLGQASSAKIVDMESYWVARVSSGKGIPFLSIRAISDTAGDTLPPFDRLVRPDGTLQLRRAAMYFLAHPRQLWKLYRFYRQTRRAGNNLTASVDRLVAKL